MRHYWQKEFDNACKMPEDMGGGICGCDYPPSTTLEIVRNSNVIAPEWLAILPLLSEQEEEDIWFLLFKPHLV